ncbi:putative signal transducing protein [Flavisericum labens]|uniref:putative signal transducing protein n=1 Tax=Flavisericum labens TaxID=3377112 RepID=UPI00387B98D2
MSNYIKLFTGDYAVVQRIVAALEKEDIIPVVQDETDSGLAPIFGSSGSSLQKISVHKDELERAQPIVEKLTSELEA